MDSPENPENSENSQEIPEKEPENSQEIPEKEPENSQEIVKNEPENSVKRGRPRKTEEEKRATRQQKYQRAKERRQVRVVELPTISENQDKFQIREPVREPLNVFQRQETSLEILQRALREGKEQERLRKEALYDSWFERLKRNNARY